LKQLKANKRYADIPVMFLTSCIDTATEASGFEMGVMDFIIKPFSGPVLLKRIKKHLLMEDIINDQTAKLQLRTEKLLRLQNAIVSGLVNMVEIRDELTGCHIQRTASYIDILMKAMLEKGVYKEELEKWDLEEKHIR
jgi:putative two-component system response regulator